MRAWRLHELGHPSTGLVLEEIAEPQPGPTDVAIRVEAAVVNFADILVCEGTYQDRPGVPLTPGLECCGTVQSAPTGSGFRVGARVAGMTSLPAGAFAEKALLRAATAVDIPDAIPATDGAVLYGTYLTAHIGLHRRARLIPGEWLLVHGAAGGVGSAALQLGLAAGARVIAVASSGEKAAYCTAMGAHQVVDLSVDDLDHEVREITAGHGVDVAFDPVGGPVGDATRRLMAWEGRLLVVGLHEVPDALAALERREVMGRIVLVP